jgi:GNAT superfamily N-acetyltransferase
MVTQITSGPVHTPGLPTPADVRDAQLHPAAAHRAMAEVVFHTWWRHDPFAKLPHLLGFNVEIATDYQLIADLARLDLAEVLVRVQAGHRPYIARLGSTPVAYGWSAARRASIGELGLEFAVLAGNRYLWDFATLPAWRGRGIYPRLLHAIVCREATEAARFWIGHVDGNYASMRGIIKAGFGAAGSTDRGDGRTMVFAATGSAARAQACAKLLGLSMSIPVK